MHLPTLLPLLSARLLATLLLGVGLIQPAQAAEPLMIGVLAKHGAQEALRRWAPTAQYLTDAIDGARFSIVPLSFDAVSPAIESANVDLLLANPAIFVDLEASGDVSRLVTLRTRGPDGEGYTEFGGVIFVRSDRTDLSRPTDVRGKRLAAVERYSLGGFLAAWRALRREGVELEELDAVEFLGTHDAVVRAVLAGEADVGTVRTGTLERMAAEGDLDLTDIRVIAPRFHEGFAFRVSTALYPEWPLASVRGLGDTICDQVATALLAMPPDSEAARTGLVTGWSAVGNYQPVRELMQELEIGPYARSTAGEWARISRRYAPWLLAGAAVILLLAFGNTLATTRARYRTRTLATELESTRRSNEELEQAQHEWTEIFDAVGDPLFVHDEKLNIVWANAGYLRAAGMTRERTQGLPYYEVFPKLGRPLAACRLFPEAVGGEAEEVVLPTGETFLSRSFGIGRPDGSYSNAVHLLVGMTAAQTRRLLLARALEQGSEGMAVCSAELEIIYANPALEEMLGLPHGGLNGVRLRELTGPEGENRFAPMAESEGPWRGAMELIGAQGRRVAVRVGAGRFLDERTGTRGLVLIVMQMPPGEQ